MQTWDKSAGGAQSPSFPFTAGFAFKGCETGGQTSGYTQVRLCPQTAPGKRTESCRMEASLLEARTAPHTMAPSSLLLGSLLSPATGAGAKGEHAANHISVQISIPRCPSLVNKY